MAGYKIQLKDKHGNKQYPVSTTNMVVDADGVSVADLLDRKQPTLVSGVNIKTINGKTLLGEGDLVIEGGTADLSGYATEEYVDAKVGESYPIYYSYDGTPLTEEQKAANKMAVDKYAENESIILYPYNSSVGHPFDVVLTLSGGVWETAELTNYIFAYFNDDGTTMHYVKVTVEQDGDAQVEFSAESPLVLASKAYVNSKVSSGSSDESHPVYTPLEGQELTEEQKAVNKKAYDAVVIATGADAPQMPHLYPYDLGKQFPLIVFDYNVEDGYVEMLLNIDLMPDSLSDFGIPLLSTGLISLSEGLKLYADGSVTYEYGDTFITPSVGALMELAQKGGGSNTTETDPVFKASPAAAITQADITRWNSNTGGGGSVTVDSAMSETSTNPVQNKVITKAISDIEERVSNMEDFFGEGANLTLSIKSNQGTDETISAVKATIKYDGQSMESGSGIIGLPAFASIQIIFPDIEGYKTPAPISFDTNGHPISYSVTYETEIVNVNLSAWDGASVNGQIVTINGKNYTWDGNDIQHKVAFGVEYWVYASDKSGYVIKGDKFVASQTNRTVSLVYNGVAGSFITIDQNIADSATRVSGDINGEHIQLIRNNSHRYLGKYTSDGTMTLCQLDDGDSHYYSDGSEAVLTGSQGDVFMKLPRFFYTVNERRPDVWSMGFYYGNSAPSSAWVEWDGNDLIGVFKTNDNARSIAVDSTYRLSKDTYSAKASARGKGYSLIKWRHHGIMAVLYFALYGNTNSQAIIGSGIGPANRACGSTSSLGMTDTVASEAAINFWGLENWWGAGYEFFENVTFLYDTWTWKIVEDDGTIRERTARGYSNYLGKCYIDIYLDFVERPDSRVNYSETTGYCDEVSHYMSSANERVVQRGAMTTAYNGVLGMMTQIDSSASNVGNYLGGSRICFRGTIIINNDSTAFKALTAIN